MTNEESKDMRLKDFYKDEQDEKIENYWTHEKMLEIAKKILKRLNIPEDALY